MIFQTELTSLESELSQLELMLIAKRQQMGFFQNLQNQADECLEKLSRVVNHAKENTASGAIASLKSAVLTLFTDDDGTGDDGGNEPTNPTSDTDPTPGGEVEEPELIAFNGETGDYLLTDGTTSVEEEPPQTPEILNAGSRFWFGAESNTGTVIQQLKDVEYEVQIDGAVGTVVLEREQLHYIPSTFEGQCCDIDAAPLTGQHCAITLSTLEDNENKGTTDDETMPYMELVKITEALAYQRKHDGEIVCSYFGFRTKAHAQSWMHFFEAVTSKVELRQAKRLQGCKWEIKVSGLSINQIERYAKDCDFSKSYRTEVCSSKPPSYTEPHRPQPVNPDDVEPGDTVTPLLTPGDSYEVLQVMPNGILDCKSLRTGVNMGLRPSAVTLVQKATKYPPCPFNEGDLVDWKGCILRVAAIGVETLHCVLRSDPDGTKPHTRVAIAECSMVDDF